MAEQDRERNVSGDKASQASIVNLLFQTEAIRISAADKPFWYTSGTIGPFYINTHFLYDGENNANELLAKIDHEKEDILLMPGKITAAVLKTYENSPSYRLVIDTMLQYIENNMDKDAIDIISGGERRDWFFSYALAHRMQKRHLTIYKDLSMVIGSDVPCGEDDLVSVVSEKQLSGLRALHISDLITEASSFQRAWEPALKVAGAHIDQSLTVVDRCQGGEQVLTTLGIKHHAMVTVERELFEQAAQMGYINSDQLALVVEYQQEPKETMRTFLQRNPDFLEQALRSGGKDAERAKLCIESGIYA